MDPNSTNRPKSWLYPLRYLKKFRNANNSGSESSQIAFNEAQLDNTNVMPFQRSSTVVSLDETSRKNDTNFRRSFRKWHSRMKNCFSKNSNKHVANRQTVHIVQAPPSPTISVTSFSVPSENRNIYTLDPLLLPKNGQLSLSDQTSSNNSSLAPSPSRLTVDYDSQSRSPTVSDRTDSGYTIKNEISSLSHCVWYWGPASKAQVAAKLNGAPDGSFLVRDSASDRHIFSISFRSFGQTLHARIEYTSKGYKLFDHEGYSCVKELIEKAIEESRKGILCYTLSRSEEPNFPVRLLKPISRYDEVRSLQSLSRFVIRQHVNLNNIDNLCLPFTLITYLKEESYFR